MTSIATSKMIRANGCKIEKRSANRFEREYLDHQRSIERRDVERVQRIREQQLQRQLQQEYDILSYLSNIQNAKDVVSVIRETREELYPLLTDNMLVELDESLTRMNEIDWIPENFPLINSIISLTCNCICRSRLSIDLLKPMETLIETLYKIMSMSN
jgi:hypothetical protein